MSEITRKQEKLQISLSILIFYNFFLQILSKKEYEGIYICEEKNFFNERKKHEYYN